MHITFFVPVLRALQDFSDCTLSFFGTWRAPQLVFAGRSHGSVGLRLIVVRGKVIQSSASSSLRAAIALRLLTIGVVGGAHLAAIGVRVVVRGGGRGGIGGCRAGRRSVSVLLRLLIRLTPHRIVVVAVVAHIDLNAAPIPQPCEGAPSAACGQVAPLGYVSVA